MSRTILFASLLVLCSLSAVAQEISFPLPLGEKQRAIAGIMMGPVMRTMFEGDRSGVFMMGLAMNPMFPGFKEEFGITEEQMKNMMDSLKSMKKPDDFESSFNVMMKKLDENIDYVPTEEEETQIEVMFRNVLDQANLAAANAFTPEQMQKMDGMMFVLMGGLESPLLDEKHMGALELTDEQKEKLETIRKETKPERDKMFGELTTELKKMFKTGKMNVKDLEAFGERFKEFSENLKKRRMEVLTEAQIAKAAELTAKPPKFLTAATLNMLPKWMPGIDSWKPGDGASEEIKSERRKRKAFPKTETTE